MRIHMHSRICCPSRSETLSGRYLHNVKQPVEKMQCAEGYEGKTDWGSQCCMHVDEELVNNATFVRYLHEQAGYTAGMFGKYLNGAYLCTSGRGQADCSVSCQ